MTSAPPRSARRAALFRPALDGGLPGGGRREEGKGSLAPTAPQSEDLAAVVGEGTVARGEVVSKVWDYMKADKLQNLEDGREIRADDKVRKVFGKGKVTIFGMNKLLAQHLK